MRGLVVPEREEDFTADPVELFFDLVFVFAFAQLVGHLVHHPTWTGVGQAALLFVMIWMVWSQFTWSANAVSGNSRPVRAFFLVAAAATVPAAASISTAYDNGGVAFGAALGVILVMGILVMKSGLDSGMAEYRSLAIYSGPIIVSALVMIAGGFVDDGLRVGFWIASMGIMAGATVWAGSTDWILRTGHFAERHALIVIVALGEIVVAIAQPLVDSLSEGEGISKEATLALALAGIFAGLLWWAYFDRPMPALEHRVEAHEGIERSRLARDVYTYAHLPLVAGIIVTAAALEEITLHPSAPLPLKFRVMLMSGLLLFLAAVAAAVYRAFRATATERLAGAAVLVAFLLAARSLDGVWLLAVVNLILLTVLVAEHIRVERPG